MAHETPGHENTVIDFSDKARGYRELVQQAQGLLSGERHAIANAANLASLAYLNLPDAGRFPLERADHEFAAFHEVEAQPVDVRQV